jgi:hypothetical protein
MNWNSCGLDGVRADAFVELPVPMPRPRGLLPYLMAWEGSEGMGSASTADKVAELVGDVSLSEHDIWRLQSWPITSVF